VHGKLFAVDGLAECGLDKIIWPALTILSHRQKLKASRTWAGWTSRRAAKAASSTGGSYSMNRESGAG
jgi:hypothetical protein